MQHSDQQQQARDLYFTTNKTQKEIAEATGVSDRTIRLWIKQNAWDRLKRAAIAAPSIIADNLCSQVVELQNHIASRDEGSRFPTLQEAEITRKLITCVEKLKRYPTLGTQMQTMRMFLDYAGIADPDFPRQAAVHAQSFFSQNGINKYDPYDIEYGLEMYPLVNGNEQPEANVDNPGEKINAEAETEQKDSNQEIENEQLTDGDTEQPPFPQAEESGNLLSTIPNDNDMLTEDERIYRGKNGERIIIRDGKKYLQDKCGSIRTLQQRLTPSPLPPSPLPPSPSPPSPSPPSPFMERGRG